MQWGLRLVLTAHTRLLNAGTLISPVQIHKKLVKLASASNATHKASNSGGVLFLFIYFGAFHFPQSNCVMILYVV